MARDYDTDTLRDADTIRATDRNIDTDVGHNYRRVMSAGTLAGDRVRNTAGEDLGKLEEIMIDVPSGRIAYGVLSFGGFLGMGNKLFALPWDALTLDEANHEFVLNVDKQTLENAPGFDKDNWPDMADASWGSQISGYWSGARRTTSGTGTTGTRGKTLTGGGGL